ncbi:MAG: PRC-barrel domain-containing protein [Patescibacteria group bacterium]
MRITSKQLKHLDVVTVSGQELGHVRDFVFEIDGQLIAQYIVKQSKWSAKSYIINRDQVVRFAEYKMIVDDNVAREEMKRVKSEKAEVKAEPALMRKET